MAGTLTISGIDGGLINVANNDYWSGKWEDVPSNPRWASVMVNDASRDAINKKEEVKDMRGLFHVILVNYETEVVWEKFLVADSVERARIRGVLHWSEAYPKGDIDDWDIICIKLGDVRKPRDAS